MVNLIAPILTFSGFLKETPYTISSNPLDGLVYEKAIRKKGIMNIDEISKFRDATLKGVLEK